MEELPRGTILKKQYQIESCLGQGGFGVTYKCKDFSSSNYFAIKEIIPDGGSRKGTNIHWGKTPPQEQKKQLEDFQREAFYLSKCIHPNIVRVYDWFEENNTAYTVMGFVPSIPLIDILVEYLKQNRPLPQPLVIKYFRQMAAALQIVHSRSLLHRDIKPQNILIDQTNDRAILIDFGATRQFVADKTQNHTVILSPGFAPYEQYMSKFRRSPASDIYALCATMYALLTGCVPPDAPDRADSFLRTKQDILPPISSILPGVNKYLEQIIHVGLNFLPEDRFQKAEEIVKILNEIDGNTQGRIIFQRSEYFLREFILDGSHAILGKSEGNQRPIKADLDGFPDSDTISRNHAVIYREGDDWKVKDLNSSNGTFIKRFGSDRYGGRITQPEILNCGDEIAFGKVKFLFQTF
jgi:serine/threonine protein kinase